MAEKICSVCGKSFMTSYNQQKYCSKKCNYRAQYLKKCKTKLQEKICPVCGKSFMPRNKNQIYCSNKCCCKAQHQKAKLEQQEFLQTLNKKKGLERENFPNLDALNSQAIACGMSYGYYRAALNAGKTFEELKNQYEERRRIFADSVTG